MAHQEALKATGRHGNGDGLLGNVADVSNNLLELAELHARLARLEWQEGVRQTVWALAGIALALAALLMAMLIALLGAAELLASALGWARGPAYLATAGAVALVAAVLGALAARYLARHGIRLQRSREEWSRNWKWLRTVFLHSGRSLPGRG